MNYGHTLMGAKVGQKVGSGDVYVSPLTAGDFSDLRVNALSYHLPIDAGDVPDDFDGGRWRLHIDTDDIGDLTTEPTGSNYSRQTMSALTRVTPDFACPSCGCPTTSSPTYRQRRCSSCGHRGDAVDFADAPTADCPDCGDENVRSHVDGDDRDVFTCKACHARYCDGVTLRA